MKLFEYLENEFTKTNIDLQKSYHPGLKAKTEAIHQIIQFHKFFLRLSWLVRVSFAFALNTLTGKWPEKVDLAEYLKSKQAAAKAELEAKKLKIVEPPEVSQCQNDSAN